METHLPAPAPIPALHAVMAEATLEGMQLMTPTAAYPCALLGHVELDGTRHSALLPPHAARAVCNTYWVHYAPTLDETCRNLIGRTMSAALEAWLQDDPAQQDETDKDMLKLVLALQARNYQCLPGHLQMQVGPPLAGSDGPTYIVLDSFAVLDAAGDIDPADILALRNLPDDVAVESPPFVLNLVAEQEDDDSPVMETSEAWDEPGLMEFVMDPGEAGDTAARATHFSGSLDHFRRDTDEAMPDASHVACMRVGPRTWVVTVSAEAIDSLLDNLDALPPGHLSTPERLALHRWRSTRDALNSCIVDNGSPRQLAGRCAAHAAAIDAALAQVTQTHPLDAMLALSRTPEASARIEVVGIMAAARRTVDRTVAVGAMRMLS